MTAQAGGAIPSSLMAQAALAAERTALRQQLRRQRRMLSTSARLSAARAVASLLSRHPMIRPGASIGVYLALPDELQLQPFIELAWRRNCRLFVPHIIHARRRRMAFYQLLPDSRLQTHRWGMSQLLNVDQQVAWRGAQLDVVLVPLLGFDVYGNRLGMGGGFYDRHFTRLSRVSHWRRPHLIGVGYACQEIPQLHSQPHDVQLEQIITERGIQRARPR
jgi:5-formyltetrahydrofolate cyclo-ligase